MFSEFIKDVVKWRLTGGHANELKRLGFLSSDSVGNSALSDVAFPALTTGASNVALGQGALANVSSGSNNFAIGAGAGTDAVANLSTSSNAGVLGNNNIATIYAKVGLTVTSDERDKSPFAPMPWTLEMAAQVKTGMFQFRDRQTGELGKAMRYGFSAQNLMTIEQNVLKRNVLVDCADVDHLKVNESMLVPVLFKLVQDLYAEVQQLKAAASTQG